MTEAKSRQTELCFDISDLLIYTMHHRNVSGIQRVQANIAFEILNDRKFSEDSQIGFMYFDNTTCNVRHLSNANLNEYISLIRTSDVPHQDIKRAIKTLIEQSAPWTASDRAIYLVTGAFWMFDNAPVLYNNLKRCSCIVGCLVYDIIPISHPEFCAAELVSAFKRSFDSGLQFFDFILTISKHTASEVNRYVTTQGARANIIVPVPLAHSMHDAPGVTRYLSKELREHTFNDFVLCVGTIEARKNHVYLFQVWKLLIESGIKKIPKLVIVGRWGWRVADLKQQLEASDYLSGHVIILSDVDDGVLEILYEKCMFTILTSFVEGWGLPVGESLAHGKLCIASKTSSIPEVGGDFVEYIDPYNARQGFETISHLISHRQIITRREVAIRRYFQPRTWSNVAEDMVKAVFAATSHRNFKIGDAFEFDVDPDAVIHATSEFPATYQATPFRVTPFQSGWHVAENFGRWIAGRKAHIRCRVVGETVVGRFVRLELVSVPWAASNSLTIVVNGKTHSHRIPGGRRFVVVHEITSAWNGVVDCQIAIGGEIDTTHDERGLSVGLERFVISTVKLLTNDMLN